MSSLRCALSVVASLFPLLALAGCSSGSITGNGGTTTGTAQLTLSSSVITFGSVTINQSAAAQTITLTNSGTATLTLNSVTLSDTTNYSLMSTCGSTLAVSANCTFMVAFKPTTAATLGATIQLNDSAANSPQTISLSGTGTAVPVPLATLSASSLTFTATAAGTTSAAQTATLTNIGTASLTGLAVVLGGTNASVFAQTSSCTGTLAVGSSCTVSITFTPTAAATNYAATLTFSDVLGSQPVTLSGASAAAAFVPQAILAPATASFSATLVGTSATPISVTLSNPGTAALTGIAIAVGGGTASSAFSQTSNCTGTLAAGSSCTISIGFTPSTTGTFAATISVNDNATGSPQTVALSGIGASPQASFTSTSVVFPTTTVGTTTAVSTVTLSNPGNATLQLSSIVLGGTNPTVFAESTTCGTSLAVNASCTISATFTPASAVSYSGTITIADNASGSPQVISLSGSGTTSTIVHTLYTFPETDNSVTPLYALVNNAQKTIDMTMYALEDTTFSGYLVAACNRGVTVRVILDQNDEKSGNTPAFNQLNAVTHCSAVWANTAFEATHQKTITLDGTQTAIMSLNLQSQYYSTTRDYALLTNDASDIAAIQATFNSDYAAGTTSGGTVGISDFSYTPGLGDDLIWSPTTAQTAMLAIINNAKFSLLVENEEMGAANIVSAFEAACQRGITVHIAMVSQSSYATNFKSLEAAGCGVHVYPDTTNGFYIHAKSVVADYGLSTQSVYMGSINYSLASMNNNRELGLYIADTASVQALYSTMTADYTGGTVY